MFSTRKLYKVLLFIIYCVIVFVVVLLYISKLLKTLAYMQ